ncbi:predicted protein [Histoplasma capsulatum G186AR]|uniref:Uncharacterized protein n=1 Tax=Ajellomyces capsulatus (strain G186AR / H82 / ATCC MYA-2454 / RMSCC 2432) TaxID=447093 RepID=C0P0Y1_AJECG|nr:uncharacterized protein HCBG_09061 [Histoplasma capsulatum G186AR]EEH02781.1 predicted protein [Histoplasma capsulatum G186AR]
MRKYDGKGHDAASLGELHPLLLPCPMPPSRGQSSEAYFRLIDTARRWMIRLSSSLLSSSASIPLQILLLDMRTGLLESFQMLSMLYSVVNFDEMPKLLDPTSKPSNHRSYSSVGILIVQPPRNKILQKGVRV